MSFEFRNGVPVTDGGISSPPSTGFKVTNIYLNSEGKITIEYEDTMAIQSVQLDPNAAAQPTGDEIISLINGASTAITRKSALDADSLDIIVTGPPSGDHKVKKIHHRSSDGKIDVEYDDTPVP